MSASKLSMPENQGFHRCDYAFTAMGSPCTVSLYAKTPAQGTTIIQRVVAEIVRLENKYSRYKHDNLMSQVSKAAFKGSSISLGDEFISLLGYADTCYQQSDGLFDITAGALRKAWDFTKNQCLTTV